MNKVGKRVYFLIFFALIQTLLGFSNGFDSIKVKLNQLPDDTSKVLTLIDVCGQYINSGENLTAIKLANQALELSGKIPYQKGRALALKQLGNIASNQSEYLKALEYYFKSLSLFEEQKDEFSQAKLLSNIGGCYYNQLSYSKALEYYSKAKLIYTAIHKVNSEAYCNLLLNEGSVYTEMSGESGQYFEKAMACFDQAIDIGTQNGFQGVLAVSYANKANIFQRQKKYEDGLASCAKALELLKVSEDKVLEISVLNIRADILEKTGKSNEALLSIDKSIKLAKEVNSLVYEMYAEEFLYKHFEKKNDYRLAFMHLQNYFNVSDSIYKNKNKETALALENSIKEEKMQAEFKEEELKKAEELKRQRLVTFYTVTALLMVLILIALVFRNLKRSRAQNHIIEKQKTEVERQRTEIIDSINYAKRLQQAILPPLKEITSVLPESFVLFQPKDIVAGDFYWFHQDEQRLYLAAADCTGHGVPGAMISIVCSDALNQSVKEFKCTEPGQMLDKVNELVITTFEKSGETINDGMDISLLVINKGSKAIQWSGANSPLWIIRNKTEFIELKADKQAIGINPDRKLFTTNYLEYVQGDCYYLITDGFADQFSPNGKKLMKRNFKELLLSIQAKNLPQQGQILAEYHQKWKGVEEQTDDITVVGLMV